MSKIKAVYNGPAQLWSLGEDSRPLSLPHSLNSLYTVLAFPARLIVKQEAIICHSRDLLVEKEGRGKD